jgi:uncharacterized protein (UPF0332 family)
MVNKNEIKEASKKNLAKTFKEREEANYELPMAISKEMIKGFLNKAELFLEEMKKVISR